MYRGHANLPGVDAATKVAASAPRLAPVR